MDTKANASTFAVAGRALDGAAVGAVFVAKVVVISLANGMAVGKTEGEGWPANAVHVAGGVITAPSLAFDEYTLTFVLVP